jgi:hypothetical protein
MSSRILRLADKMGPALGKDGCPTRPAIEVLHDHLEHFKLAIKAFCGPLATCRIVRVRVLVRVALHNGPKRRRSLMFDGNAAVA